MGLKRAVFPQPFQLLGFIVCWCCRDVELSTTKSYTNSRDESVPKLVVNWLQVDLSDCNELDDTIFQSLCDGRVGLQGWNVAAVDGGSPNLGYVRSQLGFPITAFSLKRYTFPRATCARTRPPHPQTPILNPKQKGAHLCTESRRS